MIPRIATRLLAGCACLAALMLASIASAQMATVLKAKGFATGQFGKNRQGDRDERLPTMHGFDEFFGNLYHLNAEEESENEDYPKDPAFRKRFSPRGVIHWWADGTGGQGIENTGPLTPEEGRSRYGRQVAFPDGPDLSRCGDRWRVSRIGPVAELLD